MTLKLAENVLIHTLKIAIIQTVKIDLKIDFRKLGFKRPIYTSDQAGTIELKHWHNADVSIVTKCTQFDKTLPTPISTQ